MNILTNNYSMGIFSLLGFFFQGQFMNAVILALLWEFIEDCLDKGVSTENIYNHFSEYQSIWKKNDLSKQNKVVDLMKNMGGYYGGHYLRNKMPL